MPDMPPDTRVGWGFDAHRFGGEPPVLLAGAVADGSRGLIGTSDADVAAHSVADALLGAAALGDLGAHFPSGDARWAGADSMVLLDRVVRLLHESGFTVHSVDVTVVSESVRVAPIRLEMRKNLADVLGTPLDRVSVKATSTDGMGSVGRDEGISAMAVAVITSGSG